MTKETISPEKMTFLRKSWVHVMFIAVALLFPMSKEFFVTWFAGSILADYLEWKNVDVSSYSKIKEWVNMKIMSLMNR